MSVTWSGGNGRWTWDDYLFLGLALILIGIAVGCGVVTWRVWPW